MKNDLEQEKFRLGQTLATPGALAAMSQSGDALGNLLKRHQCGDWARLAPKTHRVTKRRWNVVAASSLSIFCGMGPKSGLSRKQTDLPPRPCCPLSIERRRH